LQPIGHDRTIATFPCCQDDPLVTSFAIVLSFMMGAFLSAAAGWWGMMVATDGNAKTTAA
jgi:hypothetical protein